MARNGAKNSCCEFAFRDFYSTLWVAGQDRKKADAFRPARHESLYSQRLTGGERSQDTCERTREMGNCTSDNLWGGCVSFFPSRPLYPLMQRPLFCARRGPGLCPGDCFATLFPSSVVSAGRRPRTSPAFLRCPWPPLRNGKSRACGHTTNEQAAFDNATRLVAVTR